MRSQSQSQRPHTGLRGRRLESGSDSRAGHVGSGSGPVHYVTGFICRFCQQQQPSAVKIFTGDRGLQSAFGHIGGSRRCREANLGVREVRIPFGTRDAMVGGSGAANPRLGSRSTSYAVLCQGTVFHIDIHVSLNMNCI